MPIPRVTLKNAEAVAEHYSHVTSNEKLMRRVHQFSGWLFQVMTHYEDGAHDMIQDALSRGRQLFMLHNHQAVYDPLVLASMLEREAVLRRMRLNTVIIGRSKQFTNPLYGWV